MRSSRLTALVVLAGTIAGGLLVQAAEEPAPDAPDTPVLHAGVALPAARSEPTLSSTWYCAGGTATATPDDFADHVLLLANPTDRPRLATVTVLTGAVAPAPAPDTATTAPGETTTTTAAPPTSAPGETTTTTTPRPAQQAVEVPAQSRVEVRLGDISPAALAGAIVEVDGGEIAVEHQISGSLGRATAPCSTTASPVWTFPWGVTTRGNRELLVFMNPFPDDATVDIAFATDEGVRDTARFQGFVVPGRSVVGAFIDEDVTRKAQVSAQVQVRGGRLVIDRIQVFDGTDGRTGITLGLGVPTPALTWLFPLGAKRATAGEQVVVYNPSDEVAEVEVEIRLDDPEHNIPPEPFELTVPPGRFSIVDIGAEERVPADVGHSLIVRSLNGVAVAAERIIAVTDPSSSHGIAVDSGSPFGARTWYFPGGGPTDERDEYLVVLNLDDEQPVTFDVTGFSGGQSIAVQDLQGVSIPAGGRSVIRLGDHIAREDLPVVVTADGPVVAERSLARIGGTGLALAIGIPLARDIVIPDPIEG